MKKDAKIFVAGHRGLVGSALVRALESEGYTNLLTKTRSELDLMNGDRVREFFETEKPEYVFLAAAKVGGISANDKYPVEFIYENLTIQNNIIWSAYQTGVTKLLFLGSSCIYPRACPQPIKEEYLLTGELEPTNKAYAIAKIAGITLCQSLNKEYGTNFVSVMPTNLYGPNDNFGEGSHVLPGLIRRFHEAKESNAKEVVVWGTGTPKREFLHVDDLARACLFVMQNHNGSEILNIGTGEDISIRELAEKVKEVVGFSGDLTWDSTKPDGTPRKLLDMSKLHNMGWKHTYSFEDGLRNAYEWYVNNRNESRS